MKKKVLEYTILLLLIPVLFTIILGVKEYNRKLDFGRSIKDTNRSDFIANLYVPQYNTRSAEYELKSTTTYTYLCVFGFVGIFGLTYVFFMRKNS